MKNRHVLDLPVPNKPHIRFSTRRWRVLANGITGAVEHLAAADFCMRRNQQIVLSEIGQMGLIDLRFNPSRHPV